MHHTVIFAVIILFTFFTCTIYTCMLMFLTFCAFFAQIA
jgi:hypothetical protein